MTRCGYVCLLLGALAWGQAAPPKTKAPQAPGTKTPTAAAADNESAESKVAPDAPVITIKGLCAQSSSDKAGANCNTVITRAEFEKIIDAVQPSMPARARRQFATRYANALVMSKKAEEMGLDKGPSFEERMELARVQVLSGELNRSIQEKASDISDKDVEDYYHANADKYAEADVDRIYVPKAQQTPPVDEDKAKKDDKKVDAADEEKREEAAEQTMKTEADKLRARAAAGEDFTKLQAEAYDVAGIKAAAPTSSMGKIRRSMLPPTQAEVMDLKPGEVSQVIADQSGFFIYKVKSKDTMPLDQARDEIKGTLRSQRMTEEMHKIQESATPSLDEAYFGPETGPRGFSPMPGGPGAPPPPQHKPPTPPGSN